MKQKNPRETTDNDKSDNSKDDDTAQLKRDHLSQTGTRSAEQIILSIVLIVFLMFVLLQRNKQHMKKRRA